MQITVSERGVEAYSSISLANRISCAENEDILESGTTSSTLLHVRIEDWAERPGRVVAIVLLVWVCIGTPTFELGGVTMVSDD